MPTKRKSVVAAQIAEVLARNGTVEEAARAAGVSESTVHRLKRKPQFERMVNDAAQRLSVAVERRSLVMVQKAFDKIEFLLENADSHTVLAHACRLALDAARHWGDVATNRRLREVESRVGVKDVPRVAPGSDRKTA